MDFIGDHAFVTHLGNLFSHQVSDLLATNYSNIQKINILGDMQNSWNSFVKSGQCWALMIGAFFGYVIRSMTSY
jgi:hypothetical protein